MLAGLGVDGEDDGAFAVGGPRVPDAIQGVVDDLTKLGYVKGDTKASDIFRLDMIKSLQK